MVPCLLAVEQLLFVAEVVFVVELLRVGLVVLFTVVGVNFVTVD